MGNFSRAISNIEKSGVKKTLIAATLAMIFCVAFVSGCSNYDKEKNTENNFSVASQMPDKKVKKDKKSIARAAKEQAVKDLKVQGSICVRMKYIDYEAYVGSKNNIRNVFMRFIPLNSSKYGKLYKITYGGPSKKNSVKNTLGVFWEVNDEIYLIQGGDLTKVDEKALINEGKLPKYAEKVCSKKAKKDALEETAVGRHKIIEKHKGGFTYYRSYSINLANNPEGKDILQLAWDKNKRLVGYRAAYSAAGGGLVAMWNTKEIKADKNNMFLFDFGD